MPRRSLPFTSRLIFSDVVVVFGGGGGGVFVFFAFPSPTQLAEALTLGRHSSEEAVVTGTMDALGFYRVERSRPSFPTDGRVFPRVFFRMNFSVLSGCY